MTAYTSDSLLVYALQHGFQGEWLWALGLKKNMSLVTDDMSQPKQLDDGSTLPAFTWPLDSIFTDDDEFGCLSHDMSFIIRGMWKEFPYLRRIEDFPYPSRYKCGSNKSRLVEVQPNFGMYCGVIGHKECGLPVSP